MIWRRQEQDVVSAVQRQAEQAVELEGTEYQELLNSPRTNPMVRGHHDQLRDAQQRAELDQAHRRALRRGRVADRRAAHAERAVEAIQTAREAISPARSVVALLDGRRRFMAGALAASILLSVGSALGLAAISVHFGGPALAGYLAELCLTVMTTAAVLYRGHVDQHSVGQHPEPSEDSDAPPAVAAPWQGWRRRVLWVLIVVPLATSVAVNLAGSVFTAAAVSPVSALCAVGAGAAAVFAYLVADVSSVVVHHAAAAVRGEDIAELRAEAMDNDAFAQAATTAQAPQESVEESGPRRELRAVRDPEDGLAITDAVVYLAGHEPAVLERAMDIALDDETTREALLDILHNRAVRDAGAVPDDASGLPPASQEAPEESGGGTAVADPPEGGAGEPAQSDSGADSAAQSAQEGRRDRAAEARRARSAYAEQRRDIAEAMWADGMSVAEIASEMGHDRRTITGYLQDRGISAEEMARRAGGEGS